MDLLSQVKEMLCSVFALDSIDEIKPEDSIISDLGADSLDFVEIIYKIEQQFGVILKANEIIIGDQSVDPDTLFIEGKLSDNGAQVLKNGGLDKSGSITSGMSRSQFMTLLTVNDLTKIIDKKMREKHA